MPFEPGEGAQPAGRDPSQAWHREAFEILNILTSGNAVFCLDNGLEQSHLIHSFLVVWCFAYKHLVKHDSERPMIGTLVMASVLNDFRGQVQRGSTESVRLVFNLFR